jgi:hypothetical protein
MPARPLVVTEHPDLAAWCEPRTTRVRAEAARVKGKFKLAARPDTVDFRDQMYVASLVEVPRERLLADYRQRKIPVLDQGEEGACTGFALATVVHYLLMTRTVCGTPASQKNERTFNLRPVSPHMLYRMARRYDEWAGEDDEGSSARGAMKGWHKHGVCALATWPAAGKGRSSTLFSEERAQDALSRPLGGYFRVNHRDIVAMHAALAEVGILYATSWVHAGWDDVGRDGRIALRKGNLGGHAFAIVAYDGDGFWIQNSWGPKWGHHGFCHLTYDDWLANGTDIWVGRLGAPVVLAARTTAGRAAEGPVTAGVKTPLALAELRPHVISIGDGGRLRTTGVLGTSAEAVHTIFADDLPRLTAGWKKRRLLLYAHGGLVGEDSALQRVQDYRPTLLAAEVYPLAFIWKTDYWTTIANALADAVARRRPEGVLDQKRDFLLDRLDDVLEPLARCGTGKLVWDELKDNGLRATRRNDGGARLTVHYLQELARQGVEIHVAAHSAGSIFLAPLVQMLNAAGVPLKTCTLWAPACTIDLFQECYRPGLDQGLIDRLALFTLTDKAERDDHCAHIYHKSLLYLISHAFEKHARNPLIPGSLDAAGVAILGLEWWLTRDARTRRYFQRLDAGMANLADEKRAVWVVAPNTFAEGSRNASTAQHHGDFDDDAATVKATLARILGRKSVTESVTMEFSATAAGNKQRRRSLDA